MRNFVLFLLSLFIYATVSGQAIAVSGQCINGTSTLNKVANVNGRTAFQGSGTVQGIAGVLISIYWLPAPDNVWVLDFDGQPFYMNTCNRTTPPSTATSCTWSVVSGQTCTGGSALSITGTGTLPVRLSNFTATQAGAQVQLNWKTQAETNNRGFDIQRSHDGITWSSIGFVNGAGNSTQEKAYLFNDVTPIQGKNYYRLLQVDQDNNSSVSTTVMVDISTKGFYTLQNSGNGQYRLHIGSAGPVELTLLDLNGKKLFTKTATQGSHLIDITAYAQGVYLLQVRKDNLVLAEKLVNQ